LLLAGKFSQSEVEDFSLSALGYENISGLDVTMEDAFRMGGIQCIRNRNGYIE
jgi:hypothetical protein